MDQTKYGKYFITGFQTPEQRSAWGRNVSPKDEFPLLSIGADTIKGLMCFAQCNWFWPSLLKTKLETRSTKPHSHTYDEVIGLIGTDFDNPHDLHGEVEMYIGGEKHIVTQSCLVYLPAGLEHGPFRELKMERPIFQFEFGLNGIHD